MKSTIDAGGVKTINLDQEVDFSKKKSADGTKNINSKFSVFTTQCELDVKVKKPQEGAETSRKNNLS